MTFTAIDIETANPDLSSICQIGIVRFEDGNVSEKWQTLLNPEDYFDPINTSIHGIDENSVTNAPTFREIADLLGAHMSRNVLVCHTHFDRNAINATFIKYGLTTPQVVWLDSAKVVRRTWPDLSKRGFGLKDVADRLGITFKHHDAQEDARAAGEILIHAIQTTGLSISEWLVRVKRPITVSGGGANERISREGNPEGPLYGEVVVFTGALTLPRREAADLAAQLGCDVSSSVTKATTLLVVGDQDIRKLGGKEKSSKHRRAEELITRGQYIRILRETDFQSLITNA